MKLIYLLFLSLYAVSAATELSQVSSSPKDWKIESVLVKYEGNSRVDYLVTIKFRNVSKRPIIIATNTITSLIGAGQLSSSEESAAYFKECSRMYHASINKPSDLEISPNETYTTSYRNSSKFEGKKINLSVAGKSGVFFIIGSYTLKLTKMDKKSQQTNR